MSDESTSYPEAVADAALRRAAQLQAEAADRIERKALARASDNQLSGAELAIVAREAGIAEEYLALALAEVAQQGSESLAIVDPNANKTITRWLGTQRRSLSVSRSIAVPAAELLAVLPDAFESDEFRLIYEGHSGAHPLEGGVMQFRMPKLGDMVQTHQTFTQLCYRLHQLEIWSLQATLHDHGPRTEVVVYVDLRRGAAANVVAARRFTAGFGVLGLAGVAGLCLSGGLGAIAMLPALAAGAASGGLTMLGYRSSYRSALGETVTQLEALLDAVERKLRRRALNQPQ